MIPTPKPDPHPNPFLISQIFPDDCYSCLFIVRVNPVMMCADDVQATSSKSTHHQRLQAQRQMVGKQGTLTRKHK